MDLHELVDALLTHDMLTARQMVADAQREGLVWASVPEPGGLDASARAVAAGVVEMLAARAHQSPPSWTGSVDRSPTPVFLVRAALTMPRLRRLCEEEGPEPLRCRAVMAPPDFLTVA